MSVPRELTLVSSDNKVICVDDDVVACSTYLRRRITDDRPRVPIHLDQIISTVLEKVIEYCVHYRGQTAAAMEAERRRMYPHPYSTQLTEWDDAFMDVDQSVLFDIILAAHYLDIRSLLDAGSMRVANMVYGKTVDQIRVLFNIVNDFTPEEEERLKRENEWVDGP